MSAKENIKSLGIPKQYTCKQCHKRNYRTAEKRRNMADCMIANCKGIWCLEHCGHCGYVNTVYPTAINGVACTREECKQLFEEIRQYDQRAAVDNTPDSTP